LATQGLLDQVRFRLRCLLFGQVLRLAFRFAFRFELAMSTVVFDGEIEPFGLLAPAVKAV
jgi:hypothetical protein